MNLFGSRAEIDDVPAQVFADGDHRVRGRKHVDDSIAAAGAARQEKDVAATNHDDGGNSELSRQADSDITIGMDPIAQDHIRSPGIQHATQSAPDRVPEEGTVASAEEFGRIPVARISDRDSVRPHIRQRPSAPEPGKALVGPADRADNAHIVSAPEGLDEPAVEHAASRLIWIGEHIAYYKNAHLLVAGPGGSIDHYLELAGGRKWDIGHLLDLKTDARSQRALDLVHDEARAAGPPATGYDNVKLHPVELVLDYLETANLGEILEQVREELPRHAAAVRRTQDVKPASDHTVEPW
jgi:hypothetical protein